MSRRRLFLFASLCAALTLPSSAQLIPDLGSVTGPVKGVLPPLPTRGVPVVDQLLGQEEAAQELVTPSLDRLGSSGLSGELSGDTLKKLRRERLDRLVREHRDELEEDRDDHPVRRGELLLVDPDAAGLAAATAAGFTPIEDRELEGLGIRIVRVSVPDKAGNVRSAIKRLRKIAPGLTVDYNHVFEPAGGALASSAATVLQGGASGRGGSTVAIIDGGVAAHPSLSGASVRQRAFSGKAVATGHGTAVASLLVGHQGAFHGAARGANLLVGDVYGGNPAAGSATAIASAIGWAVSQGAHVVNISLVGPPNALIERAVRRARAKGAHIVAAVGNNGPAAPAPYPASYQGVLAITGVDAKGRALREAGRSPNLAFAAPGADMAAALMGKGYGTVRGTSFAAPLASARLLRAGSPAALEKEAVKGKGRVGKGIVCVTCRIDPRKVGAK
ncbi:S8 family serine peptidase [Sphingomicrobium lutaoense]|uniref:Peptidase S8/S53 domain-containing protein n=1 Tax=Sphingomicrobium lutaoense TaxID=515949 RepID=A0A839YWM8_9SPHN|nr:S8 family serine peptidase [Sphingomicrobium lutaoense]MBB3764611.1 hypothetical protein [Sphingomicrobium lutaoense]